ncbi:MAG: hypothetical protein ACLR9T_12945 [Thomasclavelia sp.]|mgnify:CR=1 FL=1|uniref:hypothetical protein n=1 Tax=Thomasclavelia sp. TaxID=3025757 RepID=UPI00399F9DE1
MKNRVLLRIEENYEVKLQLLKELFNGSEFEAKLITEEIESMSGKITFQQWIQIGKKEDDR